MDSAGPKPIALLGVSGSGKSIVARRLEAEHRFHRLRFGDPQRDMLKAGFGLSEADIDGDTKRMSNDRFGGFSVNHLLNSLSNDWGRKSVHTDLFLNEWDRRLATLTGFVLSDDMQSPAEAARVRKRGGIIVRIVRPGWRATNPTQEARQAQISADIEMVNDGKDCLIARTDIFVAQMTHLCGIAA